MNCEHILVDGWNVIHAEPKLKSLLVKDASAAQRALAEILEPIHDMYSTRITIVYDGNGSDVSVVRPNNAISTFAEVYTPTSMTADEFIQRYCAIAPNKSRVIVISNDNMIWETVSVLGVVCMRIGEIFAYGNTASKDIKRLTSDINFKTDRQWQNFSTLANFDSLDIEINRVKSSLFTSKKMQKRLQKIEKTTHVQPEKMESKQAKIKRDVETLKVHRTNKSKKNISQTEPKRIPHIFKDFTELSRATKKKNKK